MGIFIFIVVVLLIVLAILSFLMIKLFLIVAIAVVAAVYFFTYLLLNAIFGEHQAAIVILGTFAIGTGILWLLSKLTKEDSSTSNSSPQSQSTNPGNSTPLKTRADSSQPPKTPVNFVTHYNSTQPSIYDRCPCYSGLPFLKCHGKSIPGYDVKKSRKEFRHFVSGYVDKCPCGSGKLFKDCHALHQVTEI